MCEMMHPARWIGAAKENESPVFMRRFMAGKIKSAVIRLTSCGFFRAYLNGKPIGNDYFVPVLTDFCKREMAGFIYPLSDETTHRLYYYTYDITSLLCEGENLLEIQLANGWYREKERIAEGKTYFGEVLLAMYCLKMQQPDGTEQYLYSDGTETFRDSEIVYSDLFIGEIADPNAVTGKELPVSVYEGPQTQPEPAAGVPDRVIRMITPVLIGCRNGRRIYDAGENISGVVRIRSSAPKGEKTVLRFAEELSEDGQLDFDSSSCNLDCSSGRKQIMTDVFVSDGTSRTFEPVFVWHAFRYFDVEGEAGEITVLVIHSDTPVTSSFCSSSEGLNFLYDAFIRTQLDNMHGSLPSDCPHRERLGYTGDGQLCAPAGMMMLDTREFYRKWIQDILDCQDIRTGHVQHTAPMMGGGGGPGGWGGAIVFVPYAYYRQFGDIQLLRRCYQPMCRWIEYLQNHTEDGLLTHEEAGGWCLGEWVTPEEIRIPEPFFNTCYFIKMLRLIGKIAGITGEENNAEENERRIRKMTDAVNEKYLDKKTGRYCGGVQGSDLFALWAGIADPALIPVIAAEYDARGHFDTGIFGTDRLVEMLFENGFEDTALKLLESEEPASFLAMKRHGATTLWERWDGSDSHNHPMFGACSRMLFSGLLGIRQSEDSAAYRSLLLEPRIPKQLDFAEGSLCLPEGKVSVAFYRRENGISFDICLPAGKTAQFRFENTEKQLSGGTHHFQVPEQSESKI